MNKDIKNGCLYSLLSSCTNEELNPLVDILTSQPTSSLVKNTLFNRNKPNHVRYTDLIGDEIRLFGGDSIINTFRQEGVAYDEIVNDVCDLLDISFDSSNTVLNENKILDLFYLKYNEFNTKNIKSFYNSKVANNVAKTSLISGLAIFKTLTGSAYRVTVPCVLHISRLRKSKLKKIKENSDKKINKTKTSIKDLLHKDTFYVQNSKNKTVLSINKLTEKAKDLEWNKTNTNNDNISVLNHLFHSIPSLATAHNVNSSNYMEVVVNGSLARSSDGTGFRGFVHEGKGISEQAKLFSPEKLSNLVNTTALFQIVSIAVAQKHLADISKKLTDIKATVDKIAKFQEDQRESVILGSIRYFEQVAPSIMQGELSDSILNQIEAKEAELLTHQIHLIKNIKDLIKKSKIEDSDTFGSEGLVNEIDGHQKQMYRIYNLLLLCIRARACGWQLFSAYPKNEKLVQDRYKSISIDLKTIKTELFNAAQKSTRLNISNISALFNTNKTLNDRKLSLIEDNNKFFADIIKREKYVNNELISALKISKEINDPERTIFVKVKDNKVIATAV